MQIEITARHLELTPDLRAHAEEKLAKLERLTDGLEIHLTLAAEKHRKTCTILAHGRGVHANSEVTHDDLYSALHEAVDALARQLRKNKTHQLHDRREGAETIRRPKSNGSGDDKA